MLEKTMYRMIPPILLHHTNLDALANMLKEGKERNSLCLYAISNKRKNDPKELQMGMYIRNRVLEHCKALEIKTLIEKQTVSNDSPSYSFSFTEHSTEDMRVKYGNVVLVFDMAFEKDPMDFRECEYCAEKDIEEYAQDLCDEISSMDLQNNLNDIVSFVQLDLDIMMIVFLLKDRQWADEHEWRKVITGKLPDGQFNGKDYVKYFVPLQYLKSVIVYADTLQDFNAQKEYLSVLSKEYGIQLTPVE